MSKKQVDELLKSVKNICLHRVSGRELAIEYLAMAAKRGDASAQRFLRKAQREDKSAKAEMQEIYALLSAFAKTGHTDVQEALSKLEQKLTPAQLKVAQKKIPDRIALIEGMKREQE